MRIDWQPISTIPKDMFVQVTDFPNKPLLADIGKAQLRTFGGWQYIGRAPFGGTNFWAPFITEPITRMAA